MHVPKNYLHMKILLFISIIFIGSQQVYAQQDSTMVEQYCELVAQGRLFSNKVTIDVNFGEERKFFAWDSRVKDDIGNIKKFNSLTDALNYLGKQGWKLVNAFPISQGSGTESVYHFFFKKMFYKFELENKENK